MEALKIWMQSQFDERKVEPNSALGGAIRYMKKHWAELTRFLSVRGAHIFLIDHGSPADCWLMCSPQDEDFHDLISARYEAASTIVTSNLDFSEWGKPFQTSYWQQQRSTACTTLLTES